MKCRVMYEIEKGNIMNPLNRDFDYVKDAIQWAHKLMDDFYVDVESVRIMKLQPVTVWEVGELIGGNEWIVMEATGLSPKDQKASAYKETTQ